jgi:putative sterol carrier protein
MNLEFTGPGESGWHVRFGDGRVQLGRGLAPAARATARIKPEDYLALVAGDLSYSVARMTGRIRVAGDGHFGMLLGAFFENMRAAQAERGVRGWIARRAVGRALRKGHYRRRKA